MGYSSGLLNFNRIIFISNLVIFIMASFLSVNGRPQSKMIYPEDIECIVDSNNGVGGIYIGNLEASQNLLTLKRTYEAT
jgi:hypothetical protein